MGSHRDDLHQPQGETSRCASHTVHTGTAFQTVSFSAPDTAGSYAMAIALYTECGGTRGASRGLGSITVSSGMLDTVKLWLGLRNSDDLQTQFDVLVRVLDASGTVVGSGVARCVSGLVRDPKKATPVTVPLDFPVAASGPLDLQVLGRIGTKSDDSKCGGGHNNATGLRVYEDSVRYPSQVGGTGTTRYLHGDGTLSATAPTGTADMFVDTPSMNFSGACSTAQTAMGLCSGTGRNPFRPTGSGWSE